MLGRHEGRYIFQILQIIQRKRTRKLITRNDENYQPSASTPESLRPEHWPLFMSAFSFLMTSSLFPIFLTPISFSSSTLHREDTVTNVQILRHQNSKYYQHTSVIPSQNLGRFGLISLNYLVYSKYSLQWFLVKPLLGLVQFH